MPKIVQHPCRYPATTHLSEGEDRWLRLEIALGRFCGHSDAVWHYVRKGLEAEGVLEEALDCH